MNKDISLPESNDDLLNLALKVKNASIALAQCSNDQRQKALIEMANALRYRSREILSANLEDLQREEQSGLNSALLARLRLNEEKLDNAYYDVKNEIEKITGFSKLLYPLDCPLLPKPPLLPLLFSTSDDGQRIRTGGKRYRGNCGR